MDMTATRTARAAAPPILLGLRELVAVFPSVKENTIYVWNTPRTNDKKQLPEPYRTISGTPIWTEDQIREFAARKNLELSESALATIEKSQRP